MNRKLISALAFLAAATAILALSSVPTWAGRSAQNDQFSFAGLYNDPNDYSVHIAMMDSGYQGDWLYRIRFTTEPQKPAAIKLFYIVLGHVGKLFQLPVETAYHLFRWLFGYAALYSIFLVSKYLFKTPFLYWSAFFLAVLGSGLGWIQMVTGWIPGRITPIDYWLIDAYTFFSISVFPHFSFQIALILLGYLWYHRFAETRQWRWIAAIAIAGVIVQFVNPLSFAVLDLALFAYTAAYCLKRKSNCVHLWAALAILAASQGPLLVYNTMVLTTDPVWSLFSAQNLTLSPPPIYYLLGFGLLVPFVVVGMIQAFRKKDEFIISLAAWAIFAFVLAYLPINMQRRFLLGISIPLGMLAIIGLRDVLIHFEARMPFFRLHRNSVFLLFISLASISSLSLSLGNAVLMGGHPSDFFYPAALDGAYAWLKANTVKGDIVLSGVETSRLAAQKAGVLVYVGHPMETLNFVKKSAQVEEAFRNDLPASFLSESRADWVIYGPNEQISAPDFMPGPELTLSYQNAGVSIYHVGQ